uniref:Uncharacterized protein n=1 Tax=Fagus sylvatica TaxID=28930 RepID=A0A2N9IQ48_FAGSY
MRRAVWSRASRTAATWQSYPATPAPHRILLGFRARTLFDPIFEGSFGGLLELKMGHAAYRRKALDVLLSNGIKFARIGVRTRELWLPEVGVSELFLCVLPVKIPVKRGMLSANREFHVVAWSRYLSNAPGLADQLVASRKDSAREGGCPGGKMRFAPSAFFLKSCPSSRAFRICGNPSLGLREIWSREQRPPGVFLVRLRDSFPIGIPARPGKFLAIREFHVVHECVFFPTCPGLWINLLRVRKTLRASVATSVGKVPEFSAQPYFVGLFSYAWPCTEASLGSQDMILRTEAVGMFLMPRVLTITSSFLVRFRPVKYRIEALIMFFGMVKEAVSSIQLSVWSTVRSNLGQTWSTLVEFWSKLLRNSGKCIPDHILRVSGHSGPRSGQKRSGQTLVKLGQPWSNLVNLGKTWSDFGKCAPDHVLRLFDVAGLRQIRPAWFGLPRFACRHPRKSRG